MKTIFHVTRKLAAFAALTLICTTVLGVPPGGGGGGNTGGGTIYFIGPVDGAQGGGSQWMRSMNSDGSNNRQLGFLLYGNPSIALHAGLRWFLYHQNIPDTYNPDGTQKFELFALRGDFDANLNNNSTTRVQLTNDINLQMQAWSPGLG
jgi:hypothetical protein